MKITSQEKLLVKIAKILDDLGIKYFVTGGFAVSVWGRPRATFDIDIIIKLVESKIVPLIKALRKISKAGYINENMMKEAIRHKGEFNFIDPTRGLKIDFWILKEGNSRPPELKRKKLKKISDQKVYFISPEDLILSKLQWYQKTQSSKHLEDAESVLKISKAKLNTKYLRRWAKKLGVSSILNKVMKS